jgi:hypothetical protein
MVLDIIQQELKNYKEHIISPNYRELYKWKALKTFQEHWNIDHNNFLEMYDASLRSEHTDNLWANPHWYPKAVMLRFIKHDAERVREMFRKLYDESKPIGERVDRFVYDCEQMIKEVFEYDKKMIHHFHDSFRAVSLYLAFRYPDKYAIYKFTEFKIFMERVRAKDTPGSGEHERFLQVVKTIYKILLKDNELMEIHRKLLTDNCYKGDTLMLAQDFIFITARRYM